MASILDDKSQHCLPFILKHFQKYKQQHQGIDIAPPMFVGLQGVQGAGKTTLVESLHASLSASPHNISTLVLSIDDLYLDHASQRQLAQAHLDNPLVQHRGVPGTHDIDLGKKLLNALEQRQQNIKLPTYDKSAFHGAGDRRPEQSWKVLNPPGEPTIDLVILEGWCVGFRTLSKQDLHNCWQQAVKTYEREGLSYQGQLGKHSFANIQLVNTALSNYDVFTDKFACFVQIDADDPLYVYEWRLEQEAALRGKTGFGMTDEQVIEFVNGYYPCYELYTQVLQRGVMKYPGQQLRLVVDKARKVKEVTEI